VLSDSSAQRLQRLRLPVQLCIERSRNSPGIHTSTLARARCDYDAFYLHGYQLLLSVLLGSKITVAK